MGVVGQALDWLLALVADPTPVAARHPSGGSRVHISRKIPLCPAALIPQPLRHHLNLVHVQNCSFLGGKTQGFNLDVV